MLLEKTLQLHQILVEHHSSYIHFFESCCLLIKCFHYKLGQGNRSSNCALAAISQISLYSFWGTVPSRISPTR